jgi:hypothetical protein
MVINVQMGSLNNDAAGILASVARRATAYMVSS